MNALRLFPKLVMVVGIAFALAGLVTTGTGIYIRSFVTASGLWAKTMRTESSLPIHAPAMWVGT